MEFFDWIKTMLDNGTVPSILTVIMSIAVLVLEIAKDKLTKKLSDSTDKVKKLELQIEQLLAFVAEVKEICSNTNAMTSTATDQLHMAFSNSKLTPAAKLELQKLYDACPEAVTAAAPVLIDVIHTEATKEQVESVVEPEAKTYADLIADKYK